MPSNAESGLQPNEERPHTLYVSPIENGSWPGGEHNISYTIPPGELEKYGIMKLMNSWPSLLSETINSWKIMV